MMEMDGLAKSMVEMQCSTTEENARMQQFINIQTEAQELFRKKNADYGDAFHNIWNCRYFNSNG